MNRQEVPISFENTERLTSFKEGSNLDREYVLSPDVKMLVISGPSGTGKTSSTQALGELLRVNVFHAGEEFRKLKVDSEQIGYFERPEEVDIQLDEKQHDIMAADKSDIKIIESRLGIVIASELEHIAELASAGKVVKILITANEDARLKRVIKRERAKIGIGLTDEEIIEKTKEREERDRLQWANIHPSLRRYNPEDPLSWEPINPHDVSAISEEGTTFYDLVLDTTELASKEETLDELVKLLLKNGLIMPLEENDNISNNIGTN